MPPATPLDLAIGISGGVLLSIVCAYALIGPESYTGRALRRCFSISLLRLDLTLIVMAVLGLIIVIMGVVLAIGAMFILSSGLGQGWRNLWSAQNVIEFEI